MTKKNWSQSPERFQKAFDMREAGCTWEEIAATLGVKEETAKNYVARIENQAGKKLKEFQNATPEMTNPAKTAELIDKAMADANFDRAKFLEFAVASGLPLKVANGLAGRIRAQFGAVYKEYKILKGAALAEEIRGKISKMLEYLDDYAMSQMSGKDLALSIAVLIDKVQVLDGKPVAIYDVNVSHKIEVLMPQFMAEAKRRGITLDAVPVEVVANESALDKGIGL